MTSYIIDNDYSADSLRWIKKCEELDIKSNDKSIPKILEKLQNEIIENKDPALAYFFCTEFDYKHYMMQKVIFENKEPKYAFIFAQNVPNSDIKSLQKIVVDSKNIKYICNFACFVKGADLKPLETLILKSISKPKNVKYAHKFLKYVSGANVKKFKEFIMLSKKPRYLFELAKHLTNKKEISKIEDLIIETGSFTYMRLFAEKIKLANIEKIEQVILGSDNVNEIKKFARYVHRSSMRRFFIVL